jgi:hypothetical protein
MLHAPSISFFSILSPAQYWVRCTDHEPPHYELSSTLLVDKEPYRSENKLYVSINVCRLWRKRERNSVIIYIIIVTLNPSCSRKVTMFTHSYLYHFGRSFNICLTIHYTRHKLYVWCPHNTFTVFVRFSKQTVIISITGISLLAFSVEAQYVLCEVRDEFLYINPLTPEINPSAKHCQTRYFTGDFASWTVHMFNMCVKNQQIHQLFIQFINHVW